MIKAENLYKSYGDVVAVDGIDLDIKSGEAFGLLGPNGAGKTTTINMLIGLLTPNKGQVVLGKNGSPSNAQDRKKIGVAPQKLSLYDDLTGGENLSFFAKLYGLDAGRTKERVAWSLEFAGLTDRAHHRVKTYSGGMQRRLNLACALIHEPQVILLDEPTVGVDPQSRNHLLENIEQLKKQGLTILYTTHYMEEAERICDRVAIMDHGKILAMDTVSQLLREHGGRSLVTAELKHQDGLQVESGAKLGDLEVVDNKVRFESEDPVHEIAKMHGDGFEFSSLEIKQPDLESVFLTLTGRSLRD